MNTHNGTSSETAWSSAEHQFDALKTNLKKLVDRFDTTPEGYLGKVKQQITAHPIVAIGIALGAGYFILRLARRR